MILLDPNVVSETQRPQGDPRAKALVKHRRDDVRRSTIVVGEILHGVALLAPGARRTRVPGFCTDLRAPFGDRVPPVLTPVAEVWGEPRAATALHHGRTLRTRDTRDFEGTGVRPFDPWRD